VAARGGGAEGGEREAGQVEEAAAERLRRRERGVGEVQE